MIYTNETGLPQPLVDALLIDDYDPGDSDITVSSLIGPPRIKRLLMEFGEQVVVDVSTLIYALFGKLIHKLLEQADKSALTERRLYMERKGIKIGGQFDRLALVSKGAGFASVLQDYKVSSIWEYVHGLKPERINQLNVYAQILRENGFTVERLEIIFIFRDWQMSKAEFDVTYPQHQVATVSVPLWDEEKALEYIDDRLALHQTEDSVCSREERWSRAETFAIRKKTNKKATKVCDSMDSALAYFKEKGFKDSTHTIERRPGEAIRCKSYCPVREFCNVKG